jgi:poly-gamma-glutamate synthesis protein (capsule biosynthesis protein)
MPNEASEAASPASLRQAGRISRRRVLATPAVGLGVAALEAAQRQAAAASHIGTLQQGGKVLRQATATPVAQPAARALPDGMALVASPRLPVTGVGPDDAWGLLSGQITNWSSVGAFVPLPVRPVALAGFELPGGTATTTAQSYDELAAMLRSDAGAVALAPVDVVDFRVQALKVGEDDPLLVAIDDAVPWRLGVVGDIVPGRNVHAHMVQYGDFTRPFLRVAPLLRSFDITIANLEGNLSATLPQPSDAHSFSFVSDPAMLDGMALAGIDALTVANNHTVWNSEGWGLQAFLDTLDAMEAHGMPYFGGGRDIGIARAPLVFELAGKRIAFLGIDGVTANYEVEPGAVNGVLDFDAGATADRPGTNPFLMSQVLEDISAATALADVVIPYFHCGAEYVSVVPDWAAAAARSAIDAGATMVVTNHPHVNQGMEVYAGRPIVYSPGNFVLDQMWAAEVRSGYVLEVDFRGTRIVGLRIRGVEIEDFHQPRPMSAGEQATLLDRFWAASERLAARDGLTV